MLILVLTYFLENRVLSRSIYIVLVFLYRLTFFMLKITIIHKYKVTSRAECMTIFVVC